MLVEWMSLFGGVVQRAGVWAMRNGMIDILRLILTHKVDLMIFNIIDVLYHGKTTPL